MSEIVDKVAMSIAYADWDGLTDVAKEHFRDLARAAIKAMREPTEAMVDEAVGVLDSHDVGSHEARIVWRAMIYQALE